YYALDRSAISSGPLWQKRMAAGGVCPECGHGADISPSAYDGQHLFVGSEKTTIGGVTCQGSIRELQPSNGKAAWARCLQSPVLDPGAADSRRRRGHELSATCPVARSISLDPCAPVLDGTAANDAYDVDRCRPTSSPLGRRPCHLILATARSSAPNRSSTVMS